MAAILKMKKRLADLKKDGELDCEALSLVPIL
jgi:hypothetical protein